MTKEQQIEFDLAIMDARAFLDAASSVFAQTYNIYFSNDSMPEDLKYNYTDVSNSLFAVSTMLFDACTILDCVCGDNSSRVDVMKRDYAKRMSYIDIDTAS